MKVYVVANQKGGIGKTTTATNLASILNSKGYRTLLIDTDQQGNSTDTYRGVIENEATLYDVILDEDRIDIKEAIQTSSSGYLVASDPLLTKADEILKNDVEGLYRMQDALESLEGFDYVIIDTAPALSSMLHNCLIAADEVIIPVTADRYALQGLSQLFSTIKAIKKRQNKRLKIAGLLLVKFNPRTILSKDIKEILDDISEKMETKVFMSTIREATKVKEAQARRMTLIEYDQKSNVTMDYINFVNELLMEERINGKK